MPAYDGIAEIAGGATLFAFRRCGIGAAITGHAVQVALGQGVAVAFLTAMDERAGRVYMRVGFEGLGAGLAFLEG
ncbi:MAG: hypothetical protein H6636_06020 [Anaerolineales bacterium]|nr:hypothetical protein [Anaerolineales bacterium]